MAPEGGPDLTCSDSQRLAGRAPGPPPAPFLVVTSPLPPPLSPLCPVPPPAFATPCWGWGGRPSLQPSVFCLRPHSRPWHTVLVSGEAPDKPQDEQRKHV